MYPKIIHQTWKDNNIPEQWKKSNIMWRKMHPDYQYILWTDRDIRKYIKKNYPDFLQIHDDYEHNIQRADMIRYFILYDFGGIYSDLDLYPIENIEKHISNLDSDTLLVNSGNTENCVTNSFMISKKNAPLWIEVHKKLKKKIPFYAIGKHLNVMLSTGPMMLTSVCKKNKDKYQLLPQEKFMAYSSTENLKIIKKNAVLFPLKGQSWNEWDSHVLNYVNQHYKMLKKILHSTDYKNKLRTSFIDNIDGIDIKLEFEFSDEMLEVFKNKNVQYFEKEFDNNKMTASFNHKYADTIKIIIDFGKYHDNHDKIEINDFTLFVVAPVKSLSLLKKQIKIVSEDSSITKGSKKLNYGYVRISLKEVKEKMKKYNLKHTTSFLFALQVYAYYKNTNMKRIKVANLYYIPWIIGNNKCIKYFFIIHIPDNDIFESIYSQILKNKISIIDAWGIYYWFNFYKLNIESNKFFNYMINNTEKHNDTFSDVSFSNVSATLIDVKSLKISYKSEQKDISSSFSIGSTDGYINISLTHHSILKNFDYQYNEIFNSL